MPMSITGLFTIDNMWKQPKHPATDRWINKILSVDTIEYVHPQEECFESCYSMDET